MADRVAFPDLTRFFDKADEVILGVQRNDEVVDPQVIDYFIKRLKIIDSAIRRILLNYDNIPNVSDILVSIHIHNHRHR